MRPPVHMFLGRRTPVIDIIYGRINTHHRDHTIGLLEASINMVRIPSHREHGLVLAKDPADKIAWSTKDRFVRCGWPRSSHDIGNQVKGITDGGIGMVHLTRS